MAACNVQATLANILQRLRALEDNQSRSNAVTAKLRLEMEDGLSRVQELEFSQETSLREINSILQRFGDQMKTSRRKDQEKLRAGFAHLREEIEEERNMCRVLKLQNKKLLKELEEANVAAAETGEELHRERRGREIMEEVCNELAREIGEDKAEVEQLKHEHAKSREKVEQELKMMRMASMGKDERVQAKIFDVECKLDDIHNTDLPIIDLKNRVEGFVTTLSVTGREPYKASTNPVTENKDERQKKNMIEHAKLLRCALEFSMRQLPGNGAGSQTQPYMDLEDEKIATPFIDDERSQTSVCECCSDKIDECNRGESCGSVDHVDFQVRRSGHMLNYSKKLCKHRNQSQIGGDPLHHNDNMVKQVRKHLHDSNDDSESECTSRQTTFDSASGKETSDQNQLSFHPPGSQKSPEKNADVWEENVLLSSCKLNCYNTDDMSQASMDDIGKFSTREHYRMCPASHGRPAEQMDAAYLWKSPTSSCQEHLRMDDDRIDRNTQFSIHYNLCKDANSVCASGANSCEGELGEFDGFYFEPVMGDVGVLEAEYRQDPDVNVCADGANHGDEHGTPISEAYNRLVQQSRSPTEVTHNSGVKWSNAKSGGMSSMASRRDGALSLSPPLPHKLVLPTPNAIRAPLGKSPFVSCRSATRSISPSKVQVLQCFRPLPSSPEHELAKLFVHDSSERVAKGEGVEGQHSERGSNGRACLLRPSFNRRPSSLRREEEGARHVNVAHLDKASGGETEISEDKGNSLRAELLRARELDLQHINANVNTKAMAPSLLPNKSSSPSSFRFSPLRRSLTSSSQVGR